MVGIADTGQVLKTLKRRYYEEVVLCQYFYSNVHHFDNTFNCFRVFNQTLSIMSKEELFNEVLFKVMDLSLEGNMCWCPEEIRAAIELAYNKAIDDAKKIENIGVLGQRELEQLKI